jgi:hypothetical protein
MKVGGQHLSGDCDFEKLPNGGIWVCNEEADRNMKKNAPPSSRGNGESFCHALLSVLSSSFFVCLERHTSLNVPDSVRLFIRVCARKRISCCRRYSQQRG